MALSRDDIKDRVQQSTDLVRLIGEQVMLRPKGREFVGLCPFHDDQNPSMSVSPTKQIYKCFSCGAGGDAFSFVMNYHKMTFPEAIEHLAERAGIEIPKNDWQKGDGQGTSQRKQIGAANEQAMEFFKAMLRHPEHGKVAREYLEQRGMNLEMQAAFGVGVSPDRWDGLALTIAKKGWETKGFELAGLISPRKGGDGLYDRLRHRLIFPICDPLGRPIAFGGRKLREEDEPKYLNSPETTLFNKSRTLYGLHLAKKAIIDAKVAVIVEGYTDVIACHQRGACNVVATLGTALTREHVAELRRFAEKVVLIFDADAAGDKAAERAVELFLTGDLDVAIAHLPDGLDPFDLMRREDGLELWQAALDDARDALDYQYEQVRRRLDEADTVTGRQRVVEDYVSRIAQLGLHKAGAIRRALVVQRLSELLKMPENQLNTLLLEQQKRAQPRQNPRFTEPSPSASPANSAAPPQPADPDEAFHLEPDEADLIAMGDVSGEVSPFASENKGKLDVAPAENRRRLKAMEMAERQVIGALMRDATLFDRTLAEGCGFDELMTPDRFVSPGGRALYERLYERLVSEQETSMHRLLSDFAEQGRQDLADLLTAIDAEAEQVAGDSHEQIEKMWRSASEALLKYHDETSWLNQRQSARESASDEDKLALIQEMLEHRRRNPSPSRIARVADG